MTAKDAGTGDPTPTPTPPVEPPGPSIDMEDLKQTVKQWVDEFLPGKTKPKVSNAEDEMARRVRDEVERVIGTVKTSEPKTTPTPEQVPGQAQPAQTPKRSRFWE